MFCVGNRDGTEPDGSDRHLILAQVTTESTRSFSIMLNSEAVFWQQELVSMLPSEFRRW